MLLDSLRYAKSSLEFSAEALRCHVLHYQCLVVPVQLTGVIFAFLFTGVWKGRDVGMAGICHCVKECVSFIMFIYLILIRGV